MFEMIINEEIQRLYIGFLVHRLRFTIAPATPATPGEASMRTHESQT